MGFTLRRIFFPITFLALATLLVASVRNKERSAAFLETELVELERYIDARDAHDSRVSEADVAWHLDHMLKTIVHIADSLERSDPSAYSSSFHMVRTIVFTTGNIPRGRAQATASVMPPDNIATDSLRAQLREVRARLHDIQDLDRDAHYEHEIFGTLDRGQSMRFMKVHTEHHLKIVRDIVD